MFNYNIFTNWDEFEQNLIYLYIASSVLRFLVYLQFSEAVWKVIFLQGMLKCKKEL